MKRANEALNCPEILEALQAGRINASQEESLWELIEQYGIEAGRSALKRLEKMNSISAYVEDTLFGLKVHEFTYHAQLPQPEKEKIALALEEALDIVKRRLKMDRELEEYRRRRNENQD